MNKVNATMHLINRNITKFQCPICHAAIAETTKTSIICENNHNFNISKKGSLFLLNYPVKTEYTTEMLNYRHQFLNAGFFDPMLAEVSRLMEGNFILDAGCGEGTTTKKLAANGNSTLVGLDISKPAINIATAGVLDNPAPLFMTGDLAKLPFQDNSIDTIVNILSPANYQEFNRTLKSGGVLIKVIPGNHYLTELRHLVYPEGKHATYDNASVKQNFMEHYDHVKFYPIRYEFNLNQELFTALFNMTPLTWQAQNKAQLLAKGLDKITAEFEIGVVKIRGCDKSP